MTPAAIEALHRESIVVDAHCDAILQVVRSQRRLDERSDQGQWDFPRAKEGGLTAQMLAIYYNPAVGGSAARRTFQFIDAFYSEMVAAPDTVMQATCADDVIRAKELGKVALILTMEGAEALEGDLAVLRVAHRLGLRVLGMTWNRRNEAADGVGELRTGGGLTQFGVQVVKECIRLGIVVDVAHLAPAGVRDVLELVDGPIIATHAGAHAVWAHQRNLTDAQLEAIAAKGGVVGATAVPPFLGDYPDRCPLSVLLDHIDHMVRVMGEDGVGLGLDMEGVGDKRVEGIEDASMFPNITRGLAERGYSAATIQKILGANVLRVLRTVCS